MPTKINKPSPFTAIPVGQIMAAAKPSTQAGLEAFNDPTLAGFKKKNIFTKALAGFQTGNKALAENLFGIDPVSFLSNTIVGREYKPGAHIGGEEYGTSSKEPEQPKYTTNIDPMTGEEIEINQGIPMTGKPIKALTQMQGTVAHNMSARQYSENKKMNALAMHGVPAALTMIENPSVKQKAAFDHNNDDKVSTEELKTTFKS